MNHKSLITGVIIVAVLVALAYGAWYALEGHAPDVCELSGRPIHENMRTVVRIDGRTYHSCCPRCPLTVADQTGAEVEFIRVTDYVTSRPLEPAAAFFVSESRVRVCYAPPVKLDEGHTAYRQIFDRCGPSLIAFAREGDAGAFAAENGGRVVRLADLLAELAEPKPDGEEGEDSQP